MIDKATEQEFYGKKFAPHSFYWKFTIDEKGCAEVVKACRILNEMTPEQLEAVDLYRRSCECEEAFNNSEDN